MADFSQLKPGATGSARTLVTPDKLATQVGSGIAPVFASPMMIALMEAACVDAIEKLLPAGHQSLGTHLDVNHTAPTPEGCTVTATATLESVTGRKLVFRVEADDGIEKIGHGTHTRVVVDNPRFLARVAAKSPSNA